ERHRVRVEQLCRTLGVAAGEEHETAAEQGCRLAAACGVHRAERKELSRSGIEELGGVERRARGIAPAGDQDLSAGKVSGGVRRPRTAERRRRREAPRVRIEQLRGGE